MGRRWASFGIVWAKRLSFGIVSVVAVVGCRLASLGGISAVVGTRSGLRCAAFRDWLARWGGAVGLHATEAIVGGLQAFCCLGWSCMTYGLQGADCWGRQATRGRRSMGPLGVPCHRIANTPQRCPVHVWHACGMRSCSGGGPVVRCVPSAPWHGISRNGCRALAMPRT